MYKSDIISISKLAKASCLFWAILQPAFQLAPVSSRKKNSNKSTPHVFCSKCSSFPMATTTHTANETATEVPSQCRLHTESVQVEEKPVLECQKEKVLIQSALEDALLAMESLLVPCEEPLDLEESLDGENKVRRRCEGENEVSSKCEEAEACVRTSPTQCAQEERTNSNSKGNCGHVTSASRHKVEWVDITEKFSQMVKSLDPGELVQEPDFSLFDAMSAIELMDSKMDAALQWRTFRNYPRTLEEAIEMGVLKCSNHSPEELVGIMDEVLACIATWLEGHTLAQTVFTCMYLLDIDKVENIYLRAFSLAIVKTVEYMRACICQGRVFAEDDQQGVCHGFNMLTQVSESTIVASLREAEERLQNILKQSSSDQSNPDSTERCIEGSSVRAWKVLHLRMKFVRNLFAFVVAMGKNTSQGIEAGKAKLSLSATLMSEMKDTIEVGHQLDPDNPLALGFHPVINQHLLPPSYKPYAIIPRPESFDILRDVILQIQTILGFGKLESFRDLYHSIKEFSSGKKCANVLVRSLLVLVCLQGDRKKLFGSQSLETLLREDTKMFVFPPSLNSRSPLVLSTAVQAQDISDRFFGRSVTTMVEFLRVFCQHRARQRYKIVRCLEILGEYQQETQRLDELLHAISLKYDPQRQHAACFSTWALYYILQLMIEFVCLGFEFDLYSPFEMHYVYWYLEFLYGWHETTIKSSDRLHQVESQIGGKGKRKAAKKSKPQHMKEKEKESTVVRVKRMICVGLMRTLEGLTIDNKIPTPSFEHGSIKLCFQNRFLPFMSMVTPQILSFADYQRLASVENYKSRDVNLYEAAAKHFQSAKVVLEGIAHRGEDLEGLLKVAKTNMVVMNLTAKGHKRESNKPPVFDYSVHKHFPVIRIN